MQESQWLRRLFRLILGEFTEPFEEYREQQIGEVNLYAGEPSKFLYGSDWPICSMKSYVEFVRQSEALSGQPGGDQCENAR